MATIADVIYARYTAVYGPRPQGCCPLIADEIAAATGGEVVAGELTWFGGSCRRTHWWVELDGEVIDPMGDDFLDGEEATGRHEIHRDRREFDAILPIYEKWRVGETRMDTWIANEITEAEKLGTADAKEGYDPLWYRTGESYICAETGSIGNQGIGEAYLKAYLAEKLRIQLSTPGTQNVRVSNLLIDYANEIDPRAGLTLSTEDREHWRLRCEGDGYDLGVYQDPDGGFWVLRYDPATDEKIPCVLKFCGDEDAVDALLGTEKP